MDTSNDQTSEAQMRRRLHRYVAHEYLHFWAIVKGYDSLTEATMPELVELANEIANPETRFPWLKKFEPIPFEAMAAAENAEPGESSLFTPDQWAELHHDADMIAERFRQ